MVCRGSLLLPARFLVTVAHILILALLLDTREDHVRACCTKGSTQEEYDAADTLYVVLIGIALAFASLEVVGMLWGFTLFSRAVCVYDTLVHVGGCIFLIVFLHYGWDYRFFSIYFVAGSVIPALLEIHALLHVFILKTRRF